MNSNRIDKVLVDPDDGYYECPECGGINYLDSYNLVLLRGGRRLLIPCPMCKKPFKISIYI